MEVKNSKSSKKDHIGNPGANSHKGKCHEQEPDLAKSLSHVDIPILDDSYYTRCSPSTKHIRCGDHQILSGPAPVPPGTVFECTFVIQNLDPNNNVISLSVTDTVPFPGGSPFPVPCFLLDPNSGLPTGSPVTTLAPSGTIDPASGIHTDTCGGTISQTAPDCGGTDLLFFDRVDFTGVDVNGGGTPVPVSGNSVSAVLIAACCQPGPDFVFCVSRKILLIEQEIILLPGELFPAPGNRQALLSSLDTALHKVGDEKFDDASHILGDLRKHLDGCTSADGTPDANDWINSCGAQIRIRSLIDLVIAELVGI
jgi:hypothetical protein